MNGSIGSKMNNASMRGLICSLFNMETSNIPHIIDTNANTVQALSALCIGLMLHTVTSPCTARLTPGLNR